ncbi:MAG: condensation domain-containing protein, partial [Pseudonocardiaceae bacterium]
MTMSGDTGIFFPLSTAQREVWLAEQQLTRANRIYNVGEYIEIYGPVDPVLFEAALRQVVGEIDSLHVRFVETGDGPRQIFKPSSEWLMPFTDVSDEPEPYTVARTWMTADVAQPMDLTVGPLFSYALIKLGSDRFMWYQGYHRIVMDEFGFSLVAQRIAEIYTALVSGRACTQNTFGSLRELLDSDVAYRDSEQFAQDQTYWVKRFTDQPEPTRLANRSSTTPESLANRTTRLSPSSMNRLTAAAHRAKVPWSHIVIATTAVYVHRLTGAKEVVIGLPVTARQDPILRRIPGAASNVLPLRLSVRPDMSPSDLIAHVAQEVREAVEHERYRGEDLHRDLGLSGHIATSFAPLINILSLDYDLRFAGYRTAVHNISFGLIGDLSIVVWDRQDGSGLQIDWHAHPEVFSPDDLSAHHQRFLNLLETITVVDPDRSISRIDILTADERARLLVDYNNTAAVMSQACLPVLFEAQVQATPRAVAVVCGTVALSYAQLNARANRLAHQLIRLGVGPEQIVALALPRSPELVVSILAVLKAGAGYLPLDLDYPAVRIAFMLQDAQPALLLTSTQTDGSFPDTDLIARLVIDDPDTTDMVGGCAETDPTDADRTGPLLSQHPAYVIYTSGSTGQPKGVLVCHVGVPNLAAAQIEHFEVGAHSRVLQFASPSFDASVSELW